MLSSTGSIPNPTSALNAYLTFTQLSGRYPTGSATILLPGYILSTKMYFVCQQSLPYSPLLILEIKNAPIFAGRFLVSH
jgi:hypothetical protein